MVFIRDDVEKAAVPYMFIKNEKKKNINKIIPCWGAEE